MKVLIVEDGTEYTDTFTRFLPHLAWVRAGDGGEALVWLETNACDVIFCDMRFDRIAETKLLGDRVATAEQFNGDPVQARQFLEDHQGNYILAAIREQGRTTPVLLSYDFEAEPRRWQRLAARYSPVDYLPDNAAPSEVERRLRALAAR